MIFKFFNKGPVTLPTIVVLDQKVKSNLVSIVQIFVLILNLASDLPYIAYFGGKSTSKFGLQALFERKSFKFSSLQQILIYSTTEVLHFNELWFCFNQFLHCHNFSLKWIYYNSAQIWINYNSISSKVHYKFPLTLLQNGSLNTCLAL